MILTSILITGLIVGGVYALVAMGLTLQYGVARILNLAYGELFVASAFGAWWLYSELDLSPLASLLIVLPIAFVVNWLIYQVLLTPLVRRAKDQGALEVDSILFTFGLLFVLQGIMLVKFGGQYYSYSYLAVPVHVLGNTVAVNRLTALAVATGLGVLLYLGLVRSRVGTAVRAVAVDPMAASLVAIDVRSTSALAFAIGGTVCAAGGVLISMFYTFNAAMGVAFTMKALIVVIMGGVGNVLGALLAGLMLGVAETAVSRLIDPGLTLAATYLIFILVLLIRPSGLFGRSR